jgi:hypothetical protein
MPRQLIILIISLLLSGSIFAQEWRTEPLSPTDQLYIDSQIESIDDIASRNFGRHLSGQKDNDIAIMQRLLDEDIVKSTDVRLLQGMGIILGSILKKENGLNWIIYTDEYGRSRSLQVPGFDKDFIFPATQVSRKAEVGVKVDIAKVYQELEQAIIDVRNRPFL